jgi:pimeloyl-ACP methyl ester carboxylesterase
MSTTHLDAGEQLAEANGITLCYQTFGAPSDPPMVLVMGLGAQMILWEDGFCQNLAERGFFVVRFDNRDIGKSTRIAASPPDLGSILAGLKPPYSLDDMARDTVGLLDALRLRKVHLVGASMGGMIAQLVAIQFPERVMTLTSIMSTTGERGLPMPKPEVSAAMTAPPPLTVAAFIETNVRVAELLRGYADAEEQIHARARATRAAARGLNPAGGVRQLAAVLASGDRRAALAALKAPTLVIHGVNDPLVPVEGGKATARAIPGAKLLLLERMGHTLPRAVWPTIIDAIAAHAHAAGGQASR